MGYIWFWCVLLLVVGGINSNVYHSIFLSGRYRYYIMVYEKNILNYILVAFPSLTPSWNAAIINHCPYRHRGPRLLLYIYHVLSFGSPGQIGENPNSPQKHLPPAAGRGLPVHGQAASLPQGPMPGGMAGPQGPGQQGFPMIQLQQKQNRVTPVQKPQGLDPVGILQEREFR